MLEQLDALWLSRDKDQPFVKGIILSKSKPAHYSEDNSSLVPQRNQLLAEKWFVLLGHSLFYCKGKDSPEYSGVFLTDVLNPVIARVGQKVLDSFRLPESQQVS